MKLVSINLEHNETIDNMIKRNIMNDYVFSNYFMTFKFEEEYDPHNVNTSINMFEAYLYRLLWETVFLKNKEHSSHEVIDNKMIYYIKASISEVMQFLDVAVPPALKRGKPVINAINEMSELIGTCRQLIEDEHAGATGYSYFVDVLRLKHFDWNMDYNIKRCTMISELLKMSDDQRAPLIKERGVIIDLMVGSMNIGTNPENIVVFTFNSNDFLNFARITQKDWTSNGFVVTGVHWYGRAITVETVVNFSKISPFLYGHIRDTYEIIEEESNK